MPGFRIEDAVVERATDKAILVDSPFFDEPQWIPQSQVCDDSEVWKESDEGTLIVTDWWARKEGWS